MRYLVVCDHSATYVAGVQSALRRQIRALVEAGHQVVFVAPNATEVDLPLGAETVEPPKARVQVPIVNFPIYTNSQRVQRFFDALIESANPDVVVSHSEGGLAVSAAKAAKGRDIPVIHVVHSFFITLDMWVPLPTNLIARLYERLMRIDFANQDLSPKRLNNFLLNYVLAFAKFADAVVSPSQHQARALQEAGIAKVVVISNVTELVETARPLPEFSSLKIVWVGRFSPEKRLDVALEGVRLARAELDSMGLGTDRIHLDVVGGDPRDDAIATWHGRVSSHRVGELLDASHAVLLTSHNFDNQPMVVLEAFARGRAAILSDPKLADEFGAGSILAADPSAEGLARTLVELVTNPDRVSKAASHARELSALSTATNHVAKLEALISRMTSRK